MGVHVADAVAKEESRHKKKTHKFLGQMVQLFVSDALKKRRNVFEVKDSKSC